MLKIICSKKSLLRFIIDYKLTKPPKQSSRFEVVVDHGSRLASPSEQRAL